MVIGCRLKQSGNLRQEAAIFHMDMIKAEAIPLVMLRGIIILI